MSSGQLLVLGVPLVAAIASKTISNRHIVLGVFWDDTKSRGAVVAACLCVQVSSGQLLALGVPLVAANVDAEKLVDTYGKTWHFWQVDRGDELPLGESWGGGGEEGKGGGGRGGRGRGSSGMMKGWRRVKRRAGRQRSRREGGGSGGC